MNKNNIIYSLQPTGLCKMKCSQICSLKNSIVVAYFTILLKQSSNCFHSFWSSWKDAWLFSGKFSGGWPQSTMLKSQTYRLEKPCHGGDAPASSAVQAGSWGKPLPSTPHSSTFLTTYPSHSPSGWQQWLLMGGALSHSNPPYLPACHQDFTLCFCPHPLHAGPNLIRE